MAPKKEKECQRRKRLLSELRALPILDSAEFQKAHGFSAASQRPTPMEVSSLGGNLGFSHRQSNWRSNYSR
jgi:hypothetical protein